ncbi:MAG: hypothetical protein NTU83_14205, partial [Candidatus Hydrogenedentes bacterium]|nr:hypothetical protein [Candidatus Hydrogenedentota bacterium]
AKLNSADLQTIPGRTAQRLSRRVPLQPGANTFQAEAVDVRGQQGVTSVAVERKATKIEQPENKLSVAILGSVWKGNSPLLENEAALITDDLTRELSGLGRFTRVERSLLPEALAEQELSAALGSQDRRLALGKVISAEVMLIGRVRRDAGALEIVVECISTETSVILARADAAGPANDMDQLRGLIRDLGLRITQEFPRASGQVALFKAPKTIVTNLSTADRVRDSMKYVIMRMGDEILDPATKQSLGRDTDILGEAIVRSVDDKKSTAESIVKEEGAPPPAIQVGDQVVTK